MQHFNNSINMGLRSSTANDGRNTHPNRGMVTPTPTQTVPSSISLDLTTQEKTLVQTANGSTITLKSSKTATPSVNPIEYVNYFTIQK